MNQHVQLPLPMNRGGRARLSQNAGDMNLGRLRGEPGQTRPTHLVGFRGTMRERGVPLTPFPEERGNAAVLLRSGIIRTFSLLLLALLDGQ
jgi:hypothetical protein